MPSNKFSKKYVKAIKRKYKVINLTRNMSKLYKENP